MEVLEVVLTGPGDDDLTILLGHINRIESASAAPRRHLMLVGPFIALFALLCATTRGFAHTDTFELLDGVGVSSRCLDHGVLSACGYEVAQFALLQYLPAFAFHAVGFSYIGGLNGLVAINWVSSLASAA